MYRQQKRKSHLTWIIATCVTNHCCQHIVKHHSKRPPVTTGIIWLVFNYLKKSHNDNQDVVTVVSLWTLRIYNDGQRLFNTVNFGIAHLFWSIQYFCRYCFKTYPCWLCYEYVPWAPFHFQIEIREISYCGSRSPEEVKSGHFTLLFCKGWQRNEPRIITCTATFFCLSNLLFGGVLVAVAVVFCVRSLYWCSEE